MNFFGAAIGRSGTTWLSSLLNESPTHTVKHEDGEPYESRIIPIEQWMPFPVERWEGGNYGEVQGYLRRHLSPHFAGLERTIPRRFVLLRHPKEITRSWMNKKGSNLVDLGFVTKEISDAFRLLVEYAEFDPGAKIFRMEDITKDINKLQELVDWLDIDLTVSKRMLTPKNENTSKWFVWDEESKEQYDRITQKYRTTFERYYSLR